MHRFLTTFCVRSATVCLTKNTPKSMKRSGIFLPWGSPSLLALWMDVYGYTSLGCWIGPRPFGCTHLDDLECERGADAYVYAWALMGIPAFVVMVFTIYCMVQIYIAVKEIHESRSDTTFRVVPHANRSSDREIRLPQEETTSDIESSAAKKEIANQAYWYFGNYVITH